MNAAFCQHKRVAERCPQCEVERLRALLLAMAEKLYTVACHLAVLAERKDRRNYSPVVDTANPPA